MLSLNYILKFLLNELYRALDRNWIKMSMKAILIDIGALFDVPGIPFATESGTPMETGISGPESLLNS